MRLGGSRPLYKKRSHHDPSNSRPIFFKVLSVTIRILPNLNLFLFSIPLIRAPVIWYRLNMAFGRTRRFLSFFVAFAILVGAVGYGWPAMANMRSAPAAIQVEMVDAQPADPMAKMCPCGMSGPMGSCLCGQCAAPVQAMVNAVLPKQWTAGQLPPRAIQMLPETTPSLDPAPPKPSSIP